MTVEEFSKLATTMSEEEVVVYIAQLTAEQLEELKTAKRKSEVEVKLVRVNSPTHVTYEIKK